MHLKDSGGGFELSSYIQNLLQLLKNCVPFRQAKGFTMLCRSGTR